jgi:hypothetical protein
MFTSIRFTPGQFVSLPICGTGADSVACFSDATSILQWTVATTAVASQSFACQKDKQCSNPWADSVLQISLNMKDARKSQQEATFLPNRGIEPDASCPPFSNPEQGLQHEDTALEFDLMQNKAFKRKPEEKKGHSKYDKLRSYLKTGLPRLNASDDLRNNIISAIREKS